MSERNRIIIVATRKLQQAGFPEPIIIKIINKVYNRNTKCYMPDCVEYGILCNWHDDPFPKPCLKRVCKFHSKKCSHETLVCAQNHRELQVVESYKICSVCHKHYYPICICNWRRFSSIIIPNKPPCSGCGYPIPMTISNGLGDNFNRIWLN